MLSTNVKRVKKRIPISLSIEHRNPSFAIMYIGSKSKLVRQNPNLLIWDCKGTDTVHPGGLL